MGAMDQHLFVPRAGSNQHQAAGSRLPGLDCGEQGIDFLIQQIESMTRMPGWNWARWFNALRPSPKEATTAIQGRLPATLAAILHDAGPRDNSGWNGLVVLESSLDHLA